MNIATAVLSGFAFAFIAPLLVRLVKEKVGWVFAVLPAVLTLYFILLLPGVAAGEIQKMALPWAPALGLSLSFRADGLSLLFTLLISGIGTLVFFYAGGYLKGNPQLDRFYFWMLVFMAAMLGVALADNLILLYIFWELTSLSSFFLIGFDHDRSDARTAALQALLVTGAGGLALLAGLILIGLVGGTFELSTLLARGDFLQQSALYVPILILIALGAFTKSAQFPFHFWLPNAMEAPTPVSTYLHSATMVKAGIYLLARLSPLLSGSQLWLLLVGGAGVITMLLGGYLALIQVDLKRLLAYTTVSALGMLTLMIGLGTSYALVAAMVLLVAHALYKGALFLVAGILDHETGTRDITLLGGLRRVLPFTAVGGIIAALSMAGLPPLFGFISKELLYEVTLETSLWLTVAMALALVFNVFVAWLTGIKPFLGRRLATPKPAHEAQLSLWLGPMILGGLSLLVGIYPNLFSTNLIEPASSAALGEPVSVKLALWHGINPALLLSSLTVAAGLALSLIQSGVRRLLTPLTWPWGPDKLYHSSLVALNVIARGQTRLLQNGSLRLYLLSIISTALALTGSALVLRSAFHWPEATSAVIFYELVLGGIIAISAITAVLSPSRLGAVVALGVTGYGVALIYLLYGAPDLAMTQFLIESLTVILFVLAFYHLPSFAKLTPPASRLVQALISAAAGGVMTVLVLSAVGISLSPSISQFFMENSVPLAHGRNVVNVILVDFRSIDTLGEISVLAIAAFGVHALLKYRRTTKT